MSEFIKTEITKEQEELFKKLLKDVTNTDILHLLEKIENIIKNHATRLDEIEKTLKNTKEDWNTK